MNWRRAIPICVLLAGVLVLLKRAAADLLIGYSRNGVRLAVRLEPDNASYMLAASRMAETDSRPMLQKAARLNPSDASIWIELGVRDEHLGQYEAAERYYLRATEVNQQFLPRWTLANHYFRRKKIDAFGRWMRSAVNLAYDDLTPAATLCMAAFEEPGQLIDRCLGNDPDGIRAYFDLQQKQGHASAFEIAVRLVRYRRPVDREQLLDYCSQLIRAGRIAHALQLWNLMASSDLIDTHREAGSDRLTNPDFREPLIRHGFDWQAADTPELHSVPEPEHRGIAVYADGKQPDDCVLLSQLVPVERGGKFRLSYHAEISAAGDRSGIAWTLFDGASGKELHRSEISEISGNYDFDVPHKTTFVRLAIVYRRPSGSRKFEGRIRISDVFLQRR